MNKSGKRAIIIGAGLSGLAAARDLLNSGWQVSLFDAAGEPGGLGSSFEFNGIPVERFYHFICRPDNDLLNISQELSIHDQIHWIPTKTAYFYAGKLYPFASPVDLLTFSPVPFTQRLRFGLNVFLSRYRKTWQDLDQRSAREWLTAHIGERGYNVIWNPLLQVKFGEYAGEVSAAWIWHRIWRVARSRKSWFDPEKLGYFKGGSDTLVQALWTSLGQHSNLDLRMNSRVQSIETENGRVTGVRTVDGLITGDTVLSTAALPVLDRLLPGQSHPYFAQARQIRYIGLVCMLMRLDRRFSPAFWTNVFDPRISFNGIIEYTNLNRHFQSSGIHLLYIPYYLPIDSERFQSADADLYQEYLAALQLVNPDFRPSWVQEWRVFRETYAQAICTTGFTRLVPEIRAPLTGLYVTDSTQFYPEDRSLSAAIRLGRQAAHLIHQDLFDL